MGLDGVELLMALEDEFEIEIPDEEAAKSVRSVISTMSLYATWIALSALGWARPGPMTACGKPCAE